MALLPILDAPDPRLCMISTLVEAIGYALRTLIADMFQMMYDAPESGGRLIGPEPGIPGLEGFQLPKTGPLLIFWAARSRWRPQ